MHTVEMNISATFKEMFELEEFPVDYQALNIWLISEWPFDQLDLVNDVEVMDHLTVTTFTGSKIAYCLFLLIFSLYKLSHNYNNCCLW